MRSLEKRLAQLEHDQDVEETQHLFRDKFCLQCNHEFAKKYDPYSNSKVGTFERFHQDQSLVKVLIGAFGSAKTTTCCADTVISACDMPPMKDGVRRSKCTVIRNTTGMLESTTLPTWLLWFEHLGEIKKTKKPILTYTHTFNDSQGVVELQLIFLALDREEDKKKLDSLETTKAFINELQHVNKGVFIHLLGRIGRYPAKDDLYNPTNKRIKQIIADTNPPAEDHWIYKDFEESPIEGNVIFHQPPGLIQNANKEWMDNPEADNIEHLADNYYLDMARGSHFAEEHIKVYCRGEYGINIPGQKVFPQYNDDLQSAENVEILANCPVIICWDYGSTPCVLFMQLSPDGQLRAFKEFITDRSAIESLATNWIIPYINNNLKGFEIISIGDPSGASAKGKEKIGTSSEEILEKAGLPTISAKTNIIKDRLEAVNHFLNNLVGSPAQPAFLISRTKCPKLRESFSGKYCYKRVKIVGDEKYKDIPDKTHPHSDIMDCCQYGALEVAGEGLRIQTVEVDMDNTTESNLHSGWV